MLKKKQIKYFGLFISLDCDSILCALIFEARKVVLSGIKTTLSELFSCPELVLHAAIKRQRSSDCVPQMAQHVNILYAMHYAGISGVL